MTVWFDEQKYEGTDFFKKTELANQFSFLKPVFEFSDFWFSDTQVWQTKTSGSTGAPKLIEISKYQMEASAKASLHFFLLNKDTDGLILCLSAAHVGGFMVLVRALIGDLDLWILEPSSKPIPSQSIIIKKKKWFVSMVPLQLEALIEENGIATSYFKGILLGGAAISAAHKLQLNPLQCPVNQSYGMTETVSHIALRKIYEPKKSIDFKNEPYILLPGIEIKQNENGCLVVKGAVTNDIWIQTNDLVKINDDKSFFFLGRIDGIINSGGLKVNPGELISHFEILFSRQELEFQILGISDQKLGEKVVLAFISNRKSIFHSSQYWAEVIGKLAKQLDPRILPRAVYGLNQFPKTQTMKYDLPALRSILKNSKPVWDK